MSIPCRTLSVRRAQSACATCKDHACRVMHTRGLLRKGKGKESKACSCRFPLTSSRECASCARPPVPRCKAANSLLSIIHLCSFLFLLSVFQLFGPWHCNCYFIHLVSMTLHARPIPWQLYLSGSKYAQTCLRSSFLTSPQRTFRTPFPCHPFFFTCFPRTSTAALALSHPSALAPLHSQ